VFHSLAACKLVGIVSLLTYSFHADSVLIFILFLGVETVKFGWLFCTCSGSIYLQNYSSIIHFHTVPISRNEINIKCTFKWVINSVFLQHRIDLSNMLQSATKETEGRCSHELYFTATIVCTFTSVTTCGFHISFLSSTEPVMGNCPTLTSHMAIYFLLDVL
jgi:hypothetical protein